MGLKRSTWVGRKAEILVRLALEDSSGGPGEILYAPGKTVIIQGYHPSANHYPYYSISNLKGKNRVTKVPLSVLAMTDHPETTADRIWAFLKTRENGATHAQIVGNLGVKARTVIDTCDAMMARGVLVYFGIHTIGPSKIRPIALVEDCSEGRLTAFERLAGKDLF